MVETISREEAAWLAGIIDGEGCLGLWPTLTHNGRLKGRRLEVNITNTDPRMIQKVTDIWERLGVTFCITYHKKNKALTACAVGYGTCENILNLVFEFLINKRDQAQLLLEFVEYHKALPRYFHQYPETLEAFVGRQTLVAEQIMAMHQRRFDLQRLQRTASKRLVLDDGIVWSA